MSYEFAMAFAHVVDEKAALCLARSYVAKCMEKENAGKFIEQNKMYIPSVRYGYIAEKERKICEKVFDFPAIIRYNIHRTIMDWRTLCCWI